MIKLNPTSHKNSLLEMSIFPSRADQNIRINAVRIAASGTGNWPLAKWYCPKRMFSLKTYRKSAKDPDPNGRHSTLWGTKSVKNNSQIVRYSNAADNTANIRVAPIIFGQYCLPVIIA